MTLTGCSTFAEPPVRQDFPVLPSYARPVNVPDPELGEDPLEYAARERAGRLQANARINSFVHWYGQLGAAAKESR